MAPVKSLSPTALSRRSDRADFKFAGRPDKFAKLISLHGGLRVIPACFRILVAPLRCGGLSLAQTLPADFAPSSRNGSNLADTLGS